MKVRRTTGSRIRGALKGSLLGFFGAVLVMAVACAVVWPLWYLATTHTDLYTALALAAIAAGVISVAVSRNRKRRAETVQARVGP